MRPGYLLLVILLWLPGCQKDRTIKVKCGPTANEAVSADFGSPNVAGISIGLLNTHQFSPGMLLELTPPPDGDAFGSGNIPYVLKVKEADYGPISPGATVSKVMSANFSVEADADVQKASLKAGVDLKTVIANDTKLVASSVQRKTLRDPIGLLSADRVAQARIRSHPDNRYVLVSAVAYGSGVRMEYQSSTSAGASANVITLGNFKLHVKFDCSDIAEINASASAEESAKPAILFFYVPVVYRNAKIDTDARPLDLTKYRVVSAFR